MGGTMRLFPLFFGAYTLVSAQWQAAAPYETRSLDEIYVAAQQETGPLVVSSGGDAQDQGDSIRTAWAARFPNITLDLTVDLSKYHDSRIDRAFYEGNETTDVAVIQTLQDFPRWKDQNRLLYYKPAVWDDLYPGERDQDGAYLPVTIISFGNIFYDSSKVNADDVPDTLESFIDPKWRGKIVLTYPNDDDAVAYLFSLLVSRYGFAWFDSLAANDVQWVRGTYTPAAVIKDAHGTNSSRAITFSTASAPANATYFGSKAVQTPEHIMSWAQTAAIFASTKRPETAKLFISWMVSDEMQAASAKAGRPVVRRDLDNFGAYAMNASDVSGFRRFQENRQKVEWWKLQYETTLGPAQGVSPLEIYT